MASRVLSPVMSLLSWSTSHRAIKARTVLKEADLNPDNLHDAFAVRAFFEADEPYLPETIVTDTDSAGTDRWSDSQASSASESSP